MNEVFLMACRKKAEAIVEKSRARRAVEANDCQETRAALAAAQEAYWQAKESAERMSFAHN